MSGDKNRNLVAALCYALGFVGAIFILYTEDRDKYIRFNAYQSLYATGSLFLFNMIGGYILAKIISGQIVDMMSILVWLLIVGICVVGFYNCWNGKVLKLAYFGNLAERKAGGTSF